MNVVPLKDSRKQLLGGEEEEDEETRRERYGDRIKIRRWMLHTSLDWGLAFRCVPFGPLICLSYAGRKKGVRDHPVRCAPRPSPEAVPVPQKRDPNCNAHWAPCFGRRDVPGERTPSR